MSDYALHSEASKKLALTPNRDSLGPNGQSIRATVDHRTLHLLTILKERAPKLTHCPFSAGALVRRAVEDLFERSEQWENLTPMERMSERERLLAVKHARPAPEREDIRYSEAGE